MSPRQQQIIKQLAKNRQIKNLDDFFSIDYQRDVLDNDPFLLPDMELVVERLVEAQQKQQKIVIFGDYDADGVTASSVLTEAFVAFGFAPTITYLPNRFTNGYGMTVAAIEEINQKYQPDLIVTVDCASLNHQEIERANQLEIDVIVTDHHNVAEIQPPAIGVVNPKRPDSQYPVDSLAGVGTAFALVRALQTKLDGLPAGQEKWLLDLVAIGTVADLMELKAENRALVYYGLKVMAHSRRKGLAELLAVNKIDQNQLSTETIGFQIAPRINASGRLESADLAFQVMTENNPTEQVEQLEFLNKKRKAIQDQVYQQASDQAKKDDNPVLILAGEKWHEGIVGIVASRIMETYQKPTFVLDINGEKTKGSARSFGDFSIFQAIDQARDLILTGGGHDAAGGVSFETKNLEKFKQSVNNYYKSLNLKDQLQYLKPKPEIELDNFSELTLDFYQELVRFEPFGVGNPEPIFKVKNVELKDIRKLGQDGNHIKIRLLDVNGQSMEMIKFFVEDFDNQIGEKVNVIFKLKLNSWQGREKLEGQWLELEK